MNTRSIGIRLDVKLWEVVKKAEPEKTYSAIVDSALREKYGFVDAKKLVENIDRVHAEVDRLSSRALGG